MTKITTVAGAALLLMSTAAFAAPCSTGTAGSTVNRSGGASTASTVDPSATAKTSPGAKSESPGTVGAMNNAGAATPTSPADVQRQSEGKPTAAQAAKGGNDC